MSETKFTRGPWHVGMRSGGQNASYIYAYNGEDRYHDEAICQVYGIWQNRSLDEAQDCKGLPNAHLIAAAPELYEALELGSRNSRLQFTGMR